MIAAAMSTLYSFTELVVRGQVVQAHGDRLAVGAGEYDAERKSFQMLVNCQIT